MNKEEMDSLVKQLKAAGLTEEQIMETFFETFTEGKMSREDLEACANHLGYELTDDFKNDSEPDPMEAGNAGGDEGNAADGITKEEAENAKEIKPGESAEEFKESIDADEDSEEKEWEEAQKKFKW